MPLAHPHAVKHLAEHFAGWSALSIDTLAIERYADERREVATVATVNRELSVLRRGFKLAVQKNVLPSMPTVTLGSEAGNARQGFVDVGDLDALLAALRAHEPVVADVVELAFLTCLRRGNCLKLTWTLFALDVQGGHVVGGELRLPATMTKNKTGLVVPLTGRLLDAGRPALAGPRVLAARVPPRRGARRRIPGRVEGRDPSGRTPRAAVP